MYPLAGIDNASKTDDLLQIGGKFPKLFLRDALNVNIGNTGRASMRAGLRKVSSTPLGSIWQSPLHRDVFAVKNGQWVKVDPLSWATQDLASVGDGPVFYLVLNNVVLAAGIAGIFQFDGTLAQRFTLEQPPAPMVSAGTGSLERGRYGVAVSWLRGALESPLSAITHCDVGSNGALSIILPLCMDATVTHTRLYLTRQNGGQLGRAQDYPVALSQVSIPLLPKAGAVPQFQYKEPMPTGLYLSYWRGRLVTARANVLRFSEAMAYHLHDPRHGFVQMPQRITFVHPVDGGIWVGQVDHVAFLAGTGPGDLVMSRKTSKPPIPASALELNAESAGAQLSGGGRAVVVWLAENGYVLGTPDGSVVEPQANRLSAIAGKSATSIVFANRLITAVI